MTRVLGELLAGLARLFIAKDANGDFGAIEFDEHDGLQAFASIDGEVGGVISNDDIEPVLAGLES